MDSAALEAAARATCGDKWVDAYKANNRDVMDDAPFDTELTFTQAYLAALPDSEETVERVAQAICVAGRPTEIIESCWPGHMDQARAALRALL